MVVYQVPSVVAGVLVHQALLGGHLEVLAVVRGQVLDRRLGRNALPPHRLLLLPLRRRLIAGKHQIGNSNKQELMHMGIKQKMG
jgi:hypothetical protein